MLYEVIKYLYPNIQDSQFSLRDDSDGLGPYIHSWSYPQPAPTQQQIDEALPVVHFQALVKQFDAAVEAYLHAGATAHGYTNIERACMYAAYQNPFQAESQSYVEWVGKVWAYCYQVLELVEDGVRQIPTVEELISELPKRSLGGTP